MKALLFGSIGTVVETSELQREAFNAAFKAHDLDWHWDLETYRNMLTTSGGGQRISAFATTRGSNVDAQAVHETKTKLFDKLLQANTPKIRLGVSDSLRVAKELGLKTGLVSTTDIRTIETVLSSHDGALKKFFGLVTSADDRFPQKPAPDVYQAVFDRLDILPSQALVVEDNVAGLEAAAASGAHVVAYLGSNTQGHEIKHANWSARDDIFPVVLGALTAHARAAA